MKAVFLYMVFLGVSCAAMANGDTTRVKNSPNFSWNKTYRRNGLVYGDSVKLVESYGPGKRFEVSRYRAGKVVQKRIYQDGKLVLIEKNKFIWRFLDKGEKSRSWDLDGRPAGRSKSHTREHCPCKGCWPCRTRSVHISWHRDKNGHMKREKLVKKGSTY